MGLAAALLVLAASPAAELVWELREPPAAAYGPRPLAPADAPFAAALEPLGRVRYDAALGQAARELAAFHARERDMAPTRLLLFLLDAAGAAEWGVAQAVLVAPRVGPEELLDQVRRMAAALPAGTPARAGMAVVRSGDPPRDHAAVLVSGSGLILDPVPRSVAPGGELLIAGRVPAGAASPTALVLTPDGSLREPRVRVMGDAFQVTLPAGSRPGPLALELLAQGPSGPVPLAQLEVQVGRQPPAVFTGRWPPDESGLPGPREAERLMVEMVAEDRRAAGLPPLVRDPALDAIARGHSQAMRDRGFVGHRSPQGQGPGERLAAAGYRAIAYGENVAFDRSVAEAQAGLMASLAHRRNLLSPTFTRIGLGLAGRGEGEERSWYVTQLLARPAEAVRADAARRTVIAAVQAARSAAGRAPLSLDRALARAAENAARRAEPEPGTAAAAAGPGAFAAVSMVPELGGLTIPEGLLAEGLARLGVGVHPPRSDREPRITVVMIAAP